MVQQQPFRTEMLGSSWGLCGWCTVEVCITFSLIGQGLLASVIGGVLCHLRITHLEASAAPHSSCWVSDTGMRYAWYLGHLGLFQPKEILRFRADSTQTWYSPYWEQPWAISWEMKKCLFIWSTFGSNTGWPYIFKKFYLFLVVLGLCCYVGFFPSCSKQGATLCCDILVSNCSGFSCCRTWTLVHVGTLVAPWAGGIFPDQRWSPCFSCIGMWILPSWATRESWPCIFIV